jgi:hypothetical protein
MIVMAATLFFFTVIHSVQGQEQGTTGQTAIPFEKILKPADRLDLSKGFSSVDIRRWRMEQGLDGDSRFFREQNVSRIVSPPVIMAAGDENWDSRFSFPGSGVDNGVDAIAVSGSDVYVGGYFTHAGGIAANRIAKWDGSVWSPLENGLNVGVSAIAVSGSDVYVGGDFFQAGGVSAQCIARWDGGTWHSLDSGVDIDVYAIAVSGSDVYVGGGKFTPQPGFTTHHIAKWDGSSWSCLGSGVNGWVYAIAVSGGDVYVGGDITQASGVAVNHIAKWDGSAWSSLGSGVDGIVKTIAVSGSDVYAGGWFTQAGGITTNHIAKWDGSAWSSLGNGANYTINAIAVIGNGVYAGGGFYQAVSNIAKWDGNAWSSLGSGVNDFISAIAVSDSDVYVGGEFTQAGGKSSSYIACWHENESVYVKIKVWLEGSFQPGDSMTTFLKMAGSIPLTSPYADARTVTAVPDSVTDWISVELCSLAAGPTLKQKSFFLKSDGSIVDTDGTTMDLELPGVTDGSYYIVVRHRNHLSAMSAERQPLSSSSSTVYDFTTGLGQYYGTDTDRAKQVETGVYGMNAGDTDGSGTVDASDRSNTWNGRNQSGYLNADCDLSGTVDASDRSITWDNRNKSTSAPVKK